MLLPTIMAGHAATVATPSQPAFGRATSGSPRKLAIVYFDAGGGHRAAADALCSVLNAQGGWDISRVNLQEVLDTIDPFLKITGVRLADVYNRMITRGLTLGAPQMLVGLHGLIRLRQGPMLETLAAFWRSLAPDMVVSLVPNFNRVLALALRAAAPETPFVTILTDIADYPPHFWIERESQYVICGSERALRQAAAFGHRERAFLTSGMILSPRFYQPLDLDRDRERERLGLEATRPTGLVLFGGQGSRRMLTIARQLEQCSRPMQFIYICGHNARLKADLEAQPSRHPRLVLGFTPEVAYYMALSDFMIGKPGPASVSEAVHRHLPVIVECNAWTLPQERYNAQWVEERGVGIVLKSFSGVAAAVDSMAEPATLARYRRNTESQENRAVFEVPDLLERIANRHKITT